MRAFLQQFLKKMSGASSSRKPESNSRGMSYVFKMFTQNFQKKAFWKKYLEIFWTNIWRNFRWNSWKAFWKSSQINFWDNLFENLETKVNFSRISDSIFFDISLLFPGSISWKSPRRFFGGFFFKMPGGIFNENIHEFLRLSMDNSKVILR